MGRIRTIKPTFFRSRSLSKCSLAARITFQGLWCEADDFGRGEAEGRLLKGAVWPLDDDITTAAVDEHLLELERTGHIRLYTVAGDRFYEIVAWQKHQSAAYRRGVSVFPDPSQQDPHDETCKEVQDAPLDVLEGKGREGKGSGREAPPDIAARSESPAPPAKPLEGRLSEPKGFIELVDPGGPVAIRREASAVLTEASRISDKPLTGAEFSRLRETAKDALAAGYDPHELAEAIAFSPFKTDAAVMGELRKRKQQVPHRKSVGDSGLVAADSWVRRQEQA